LKDKLNFFISYPPLADLQLQSYDVTDGGY